MKVYSISSLRIYSIPLVFVKTWFVIAFGQTRSLGWSNPRLVRQKDQDGLATFSFEADEPKGGSADILVPIIASTLFHPGDDIRGVKVEAETNSLTRLANIVRALENGCDDNNFVPFESGLGDEAFDAESIEQYEQTVGRRLGTTSALASKCEYKTLLKIPTRVEFKTSGFKLYKRFRYNITELEYCYPSDLGEEAEQAIRRCLPAAIAAGVAAFPGGPGAAVAAFIAALKACVGAELASKVSVHIRNREEIGNWHRV